MIISIAYLSSSLAIKFMGDISEVVHVGVLELGVPIPEDLGGGELSFH